MEVDVQLSDGDIQAEIREALQILLDGVRDLADVEVALESDRVDRDAVGEEALDDVVQCVGFAVDALDRVVVYAGAEISLCRQEHHGIQVSAH